MIKIIKGRYGYKAEDGTVRIAEGGKKLSLDKKEEERLVSLGVAETVKEKQEVPKPKKRKGRKV